METEVSIIIVNYNTKELTLACIDSILSCNLRLKYEIIVVDNGSTDGSQDVFQELNKSTKLRFILHQKNLGFSKANNSAIKKAIGKYILLLNSDTVVKRGSIESLYDFAKHTPDVGLVAPKLLNEDGTTQASVFNLPTVKQAIKTYWLRIPGFEKYAPKTIKPMQVEAVVAAAILITPQALKKVGLLDERYFMFFEDLDYCRRVNNAGLKIYYLPKAEIVHLHGASGKQILGQENQWRRLIPSSKIYHGEVKHALISFVLWSGQKLRRVF